MEDSCSTVVERWRRRRQGRRGGARRIDCGELKAEAGLKFTKEAAGPDVMRHTAMCGIAMGRFAVIRSREGSTDKETTDEGIIYGGG